MKSDVFLVSLLGLPLSLFLIDKFNLGSGIGLGTKDAKDAFELTEMIVSQFMLILAVSVGVMLVIALFATLVLVVVELHDKRKNTQKSDLSY